MRSPEHHTKSPKKSQHGKALNVHNPKWIQHSERSAYTDKCSELLGNIHLPREAVCCSLASCDDVNHIHIVNCLHCAASDVIPTTRCNCVSDEHNAPWWNEYAKDAHSEVRDAFKL